MERSQRTRKDFYLQGKSTAVVIGAASGVKHPTPTPAQHHPPAFPLRKGTQNSPPAQTVRPIRRFTCKLPPGDPPGRPAPMRGGPPSPPRDGPPRPRGQRCRRRSRPRAARRWGQRRVGRGAVAAPYPRVPAALRSPLRRPLPGAGRGLGRAAPPRAAGGGGGGGGGGGEGGGRLRPKARSLVLLAGVFMVCPPPPPHSGTPKAVPRMQLWGFPSVQKAFPPRCAPKLHPKGWERLRLLDPKGFGSDRPRKASWRSASRLSLHPLPSPSSERRGLEILHPESNVYVRTRT